MALTDENEILLVVYVAARSNGNPVMHFETSAAEVATGRELALPSVTSTDVVSNLAPAPSPELALVLAVLGPLRRRRHSAAPECR